MGHIGLLEGALDEAVFGIGHGVVDAVSEFGLDAAGLLETGGDEFVVFGDGLHEAVGFGIAFEELDGEIAR